MFGKFKNVKLDKKDLLIFVTMFFVAVFIFIIIKSYNIAKTKNNIESLQLIKGSGDKIKVKGENAEITVADNSFYNSFEESTKKDCLTIVLNDDKKADLSNINVNINENTSKLENQLPASDVIELNDYNSNININNDIKNEVTGNNIKVVNLNNNVNFKAQLIALKDRQQALNFIERIKKLYGSLLKGLDTFILEVNLDEKGIFYRVQVGDFETKEDGLNFCREYNKINNNSTSCIVVK